jgi:hypothetical protein
MAAIDIGLNRPGNRIILTQSSRRATRDFLLFLHEGFSLIGLFLSLTPRLTLQFLKPIEYHFQVRGSRFAWSFLRA